LIILGLDTATAQVAVALGDADGVIASFRSTRGRRHAETLVPAVQFVRDQAGVDLKGVSAVACDVGPGLFTGLRVGVATARAIAQALRVPVVGISSLDLLAFPVRHTTRLVVPIVDARRGEVFSALYRAVPGGVQRVTPYRLCPPDHLASELLARAEECLLVGDGSLRYADAFGCDLNFELAGPGLAHPSVSSLVELAHARALREDYVRASELEPLYLRKPDVAINWEQRHGSEPLTVRLTSEGGG
jgi:tRNA threonylcarbamoyladenosine biosynthesis protein TsaB